MYIEMNFLWRSRLMGLVEGWLVTVSNYVWRKRRAAQKSTPKAPPTPPTLMQRKR